jgi:3-dehydroquinate synthase
MQSLTVQLGERSYPILIGRGLIDQSALVLPYLKRKKVVVVTNTTIAPLYLARFANGLRECGGRY